MGAASSVWAAVLLRHAIHGDTGNPANENMCSKCFRNKITAAVSVSVPVPIAAKAAGEACSASVPTPALAQTPEERPVSASPAKKHRCGMCKAKVGLLGFGVAAALDLHASRRAECRCSATFCAACRFPDKHNCTFDFKALDRQQLEKRNPAVVAEKIRKI